MLHPWISDGPIWKRQQTSVSCFWKSQFQAELNGRRVIVTTLKLRGFESFDRLPDLKFHQVSDFLKALNLIDKDTHRRLVMLTNIRNKLIHKPNVLMAYNENRLSRIVSEAENLSLKIVHILSEQEEQLSNTRIEPGQTRVDKKGKR